MTELDERRANRGAAGCTARLTDRPLCEPGFRGNDDVA